MSNLDNPITLILNSWTNLTGDEKNNIIKQLYPELKKIASIQLYKNNQNLTQSTTEVVNEAYIKLMNQDSVWKNRDHFFAISATIMRRIIVDFTRKKFSAKRGNDIEHVQLQDVNIPVPFNFSDWLVLNEAIEELTKVNPILTQVVEVRVILGMSIEESSKVLDISLSTVTRHWRFAKAWLAEYLTVM
jgi:RNA polymerase sigma factor (TIGR02999 family)